jgi:hypothetical protein
MRFVRERKAVEIKVQGVVVVATNKVQNSKLHPVNRFVCTTLLWITLQGRANAKTNVEFILNFLEQTSSTGSQVANGSGNEDMQLFEPTLFIDSKITPQTNINAMVIYDSYSTASARILYAETGASSASLHSPKADNDFVLFAPPSEQTPLAEKSGGNSKNWEHRLGVNFGASQRIDTWIISPRVGFSNAVPYRSTNGGLTIDKTFKSETYTVSAGYSLFDDKTYDFSYSLGKFTEWQKRR